MLNEDEIRDLVQNRNSHLQGVKDKILRVCVQITQHAAHLEGEDKEFLELVVEDLTKRIKKVQAMQDKYV